MWLPCPPMPTSAMARGECRRRISFSLVAISAVAVLDVVGDAEGLVADVALRDGIRLVAPHGHDAAALDVDAQPAVVAAEDAHGGKVRSALGHRPSSKR